jgi:nucleoside-diphosphate-sugar epimerase
MITSLRNAHVLVTGGNGYIGNALVETLLDSGHRVTVVDWMVYGPSPLAPFMNDARFRLVAADVRHLDPDLLSGVDVICDLAALSNDPSGDLDKDITRSINFQARRRLGLLAKAYGVKRYLLASSCSVYGAGHSADCTEESTVNPLTEYALCNRLSEEALFQLNDADFAVTAFRNATVFGLSRRMRFDLAVNIMTYNATTKGELVVNGDGRQNRPFIHLRDVARAMAMAIEAPREKVAGEIFNLCYGNVTIKELADDIQRTLPIPVKVTYSPADMDNRDYRVDATKAERVLGFKPRMSIADGILEVYQAVTDGRTELSFETKTLDVYKRLVDQGKLSATDFTELPRRRKAS